jgi:hypothetical protein
MASNQPIKAVEVRKDNNINIPQPGSYISGTNSAGGLGGDTIVDLNANFLGVSNPGNTGFSNKVAIGDVVYIDDVLGSPVVGLVSQVVSNTSIKVAGVLSSGTSAYKIYRSNGTYAAVPFFGQSKTGIEGYSLYVGGAGGGNLSVVPAGSEDTVLLKGVAAGSFIPLQVVRVNSTGTDVTDILALE